MHGQGYRNSEGQLLQAHNKITIKQKMKQGLPLWIVTL